MTHNIALTWGAPGDANATTFYNVYKGTTKGGEALGAPINAAPVTGTSYTDLNVVVGTPYFYVVEAVTNGISSGPSIEATATVLPYAPLNLTATPS